MEGETRRTLTSAIDPDKKQKVPGITNYYYESKGGTKEVNGIYNGDSFIKVNDTSQNPQVLLKKIKQNSMSDPKYKKAITKAVTGQEEWPELSNKSSA